ncbi:DinB family protein [Acidicapsa acidisoli]|uniref:DinB family protein n=1 Tax=Acidicapsa acidisoli TaxID=1615681 RepID=UPI0021DFAD2E|nr:DinB family protein [Acidicapsa acidisoli]
MTTAALTTEELLITTTLKSWEQWVGRTSQFFDSLSDEQMLTEIAPGKNRPVYLLGHLLVVNDAIIPQLRLGEPNHADLRETFLDQPDRSDAKLPPLAELRQNWKDLNVRLTTLFAQLTPVEWLERHALVSEEDFAKEPHRNRLAIFLSRVSHTAYHLGQLRLQPK